MNRHLSLAVIVLPTALLLNGCAASQGFPSLAVRDSERVAATMDTPAAPAPAYVPAAPAPATLADLDRLLGQVRTSHQRFTGAADAATRIVSAAHGAGSGTDAWFAAQVAIADLESQRGEAMVAMADIDRLYVQAAMDGGDTARLTAARSEANGLIDQQTAVITSLLGSLSN
jgi:hypothetical protein